jgi:hypothetical protein
MTGAAYALARKETGRGIGSSDHITDFSLLLRCNLYWELKPKNVHACCMARLFDVAVWTLFRHTPEAIALFVRSSITRQL